MPLQLWITFGISQYWDSPHRAALRPWIRTIALAWFASPQHDRWIVDFQDKGARCHEWFSCRQCCNLMMHYGLVEQVQGSSEVASWMETQGGIRHVQPLSKSEQNSGVRHLGAGAPLRGGKLWVLLPQGNEVAPRWTPGHHGYSVVCRVVWKLRPGWLQPSTTGVDLTAVAGWGVLLGTCLAYLSHDSSVMIVMILFFFKYMCPFLVCYLNVLLCYLWVACNLWFSFMFPRVQMIYPSK